MTLHFDSASASENRKVAAHFKTGVGLLFGRNRAIARLPMSMLGNMTLSVLAAQM